MKAPWPEMKLNRSPQSLKRKTWRFFLFLLSAFCVIFIASYTIIMTRAAVDNEVSDSEFAMTSMSKNLKVGLDRYREMSRQIMIDSNVVAFLRDSSGSSSYNTARVNSGIYSVTNIYSYVDSVYIYRSDGKYARTGSGIMEINFDLIDDPEWLEPLEKARGGNTMMINGNGAFNKRSGMPLITMARYIYDIDTQQKIGLLVINLTPKVLDSAISDLGKDRDICFLDRDGNVLGGDESLKDSFKQEFVGSGFNWKLVSTGGRDKILSAYSTEDMPIVQVSMSDISGGGIQSWETIWLAITLVTAVILAVFSSGMFISLNITRPLDKLSEAMVNTKSDGLLHEIDLPLPDNEIRRLGESYNDMVVHNNKLIAELIEKEKSVQKAELRTLQEQIKPHFLYNSLETISYMALQSSAPKVHDALETLGSFYRNFLSKGSRDIPLRNEILIVKDYLALQKLRYNDAFDDYYEVEESVLDTMIPKLILQPLVENSLYHGVRLKGERGVIRISAFGRNDTVHICVYDTGVGMTQEQIAEVLTNGSSDDSALSGFGLKGTIERIRYYYNYCAVIYIRSEPGEYTEIEIIVPAKDKQGGGVNV